LQIYQLLLNLRVITTEQGNALSSKFGSAFIEASAKTKINVEEIFYSLLRQIPLPKGGKKGASGTKKGGRGCQLL